MSPCCVLATTRSVHIAGFTASAATRSNRTFRLSTSPLVTMPNYTSGVINNSNGFKPSNLVVRPLNSSPPFSTLKEDTGQNKWSISAIPMLLGIGAGLMSATFISSYYKSCNEECTKIAECSSLMDVSGQATTYLPLDLSIISVVEAFLETQGKNIATASALQKSQDSKAVAAATTSSMSDSDVMDCRKLNANDQILTSKSSKSLSGVNIMRSNPVETAVVANKVSVLEKKVYDNYDMVDTAGFDVSVRALRGGRLSMEDTYCIHDGGRFAGVFDGHGGACVSKFTSETIYHKIKKFLKLDSRNNSPQHDVAAIVKSISAAFDEVEDEVLEVDDFQYQGSTAVTVYLHDDSETKQRTIVSANVGDSRAVLGHKYQAIDLTRDHKPDDEYERKRILSMGETIEWDSYSQVSRVKNLSLSRAIGDRFAKPVVSGEVEIQLFPMKEMDANGTEDDFIILASDGLWDVMTSQNCVDFVAKRLKPSKVQARTMSKTELVQQKISRRQNMSRFVANEATRRGSCDNICVVIIWLNDPCHGTDRNKD